LSATRPAEGVGGYRPDIDGLRGLAVLGVIGFHVTPRFVPGGFAGVDVFFVISGFLITGILIAQLSDGRFSLADFYARRIRRIFPSLILVLAACSTIGWYVLVGDEFAQLQKHIAASAFFVPNIVFWREAGYFDVRSELKPLVHLWSLGIEEQFYLVWPPLLYLCWKRRLNLATVIVTIVTLSFAVNLLLVGDNAVAAFFLPQARIWELLLGALMAYGRWFGRTRVDAVVNRLVFAPGAEPDPRYVANAAAWIGLALIVVAIGGFSRGTDFPGWWFGVPGLNATASLLRLDQGMIYPGAWAAVPTLGAALVIWAGAGACVNRVLLGNRPIVFVGLISYPLYLWHWPLLSFLQITESGAPSRGLRAAAVALSFVLAWLSYRLVEQPIRRSTGRRTPLRISAMAATLAVIGGAAALGYARGTFTSRVPRFATDGPPRVTAANATAACVSRFTASGEYCQEWNPGGRVTTALLGDSHAGHFLAGLGTVLAARGEGVVHLGDSGCPPLFDIERYVEGRRYSCQNDAGALLPYVGANGQFSRVVLAFRGAYDVIGTGYGRLDNEEGISIYKIAGTQLSPAESIRQALLKTVEYFRDRRREVWVMLQVPELGFRVDECVGRPFSFGRTLRSPCAVPRAAVDTRQSAYRQIVTDVARRVPELHVFDPVGRLCDANWCYAVIDGKLLYHDSNHLNPTGSTLAVSSFDAR
jgi:peptidoglycan/LPS O-acetylase OafA/YrhL